MSRRINQVRWFVMTLVLGCAASGEQSVGGGVNLPANDYYSAVLQSDDVLFAEDLDIERPWGLTEGAEIRVWFGLRTPATDDDPGTVSIATATIREVTVELITDVPPDETRAAVPQTTWEATTPEVVLVGGTHPSVIRTGSEFTMAYVADGAIQLATSTDGVQWSPGREVLTPTESWEGATLSHPSLVRTSNGFDLFYLPADGLGIGLARSSDLGASFERVSDGPVFLPTVNPEPAEDEEPVVLWDSTAFTGMSVQGGTTPIGRDFYAMYYTTRARAGYAAAFDTTHWFRSEINPLIESAGGMSDPMRVGPLLLLTRTATENKKRRALIAAVFGAPTPE